MTPCTAKPGVWLPQDQQHRVRQRPRLPGGVPDAIPAGITTAAGIESARTELSEALIG